MKTIYLHIGYHKTATTSLQEFFCANEDGLRESGINYAKSGRNAGSHGLLALCLHRESDKKEQAQQLWSELLEEVQSSEAGATLVSSEAFLEASDVIPEALANIVADQASVEIICYVRPQWEWVESVFNEVVKDDYRRETGNILCLREVAGGSIDYFSTLKLWADAFGAHNLHVRPFQKSRFSGGSVFSDFLTILGNPVLENPKLPTPKNVSLHPTYIEFLRRCNLVPMLNGMHQQLVQSIELIARTGEIELPDIPYGASRLEKEQQHLIRKLAGESNFKLLRDFGTGLPAIETDDFFSDEQPTIQPYLDVDYLLIPPTEHKIFNMLPSEIQSHFERLRVGIANRKENAAFLRKPSEDVQHRINAVVARQEIEARWLYSLIDKMERARLQLEEVRLAQITNEQEDAKHLQIQKHKTGFGEGNALLKQIKNYLQGNF